MALPKSTAPSGITITRNGNKMDVSWKQPGYKLWQKAQWKDVWRTSFTDLSGIGKADTKRTISWTLSYFHPTVQGRYLSWIGVRIKGRYDSAHAESAWTNKQLYFYPPTKATIEVASDTNNWPKATFTWSIPNSDTSSVYWYTRYVISSVLLKDSTITDGSQIDNWEQDLGGTTNFNGTTRNHSYITNVTGTSTSGTYTITEDSGLLATGSYTRWFRIVGQGPAGDSEPAYAKHVYAMPNQCTIKSTKVTPDTSVSGYTAQVQYEVPITPDHPVDTINTEYSLATPAAGMACPDGATWKTGVTALANDNTGGATFTIDSLVGTDQALFVRVNSVYDGRTTYGTPKAVDYGKLTAPGSISVTTDSSTHKANISVSSYSPSVSDAFLVVKYMTAKDPNGFDLAIIPNGQTSVTGVQCPVWTDSPRFGVYAAAPGGCYSAVTRADGVSSYTVNPTMRSDMITYGGTIPVAPSSVTVAQTNIPGTIRVTWSWSWADADEAELSWSDHEDAWESTDAPATFNVTKINAASWNISGLETGIKWYVRVRLIQNTGDGKTYGAYSTTKTIDLSSAPLAPVMTLSDGVIPIDGQVTAQWVYSTTDGTSQAFAEVAEVTISNNQKVYTPVGQTQTAQHLTISAKDRGWTSGSSHTLACRVVSASGRQSDAWSNETTVLVADPITATITTTSLQSVTVTYLDEEGDPVNVTVTGLTAMPLTATVTGAGTYGLTTLAIERAASYFVDRPDETNFNGYDGETVYTYTQTGESQITVRLEDLIGRLDDGASYRLVATVQDGLGQKASSSIDFEVHWSHQPAAPTATIRFDDQTAILNPIAPESAAETDVCDIYRLSIDKPVLIYEGAEFGQYYADPYPTIGEHGGYRFVTRTVNGDYITSTDGFAWTDYSGGIDVKYNIIDFGDDSLELEYDIDLDNSWEKNFTKTEYLGGSIQGDWTKVVSRSGSVAGDAIVTSDTALIQAMRRLAEYPGICHVRTKDGSNYTADIQVQEKYTQGTAHKIANFTLKVTRVDSQELDGVVTEPTPDMADMIFEFDFDEYDSDPEYVGTITKGSYDVIKDILDNGGLPLVYVTASWTDDYEERVSISNMASEIWVVNNPSEPDWNGNIIVSVVLDEDTALFRIDPNNNIYPAG